MKEFFCHKYHGLGNDYIIIDPNQNMGLPNEAEIQVICDRHYGFGSDGILIGPINSDNHSYSLRLFNPDGSEFEKSGNGLRIFAKYIFDREYSSEKAFILRTPKEEIESLIIDNNMVRLKIGPANFRSACLPATGHDREAIMEDLLIKDKLMQINCVSVGNPHCVIFRDKLIEEEIREYGPHIEKHKIFPNRTNVQFVKQIDRENIEILIWERGVGYTLASGTSSCAAAAVARKAGFCNNEITVTMPGGRLHVLFDKDEDIWLTGPVQKVYEGKILLNS